MTVTTAKWSLEDYHRMIEVGLLVDRHVELLNGEVINMAPEGPEHAQLSTDTADYLRELLGQQALVRDAKPITLPESGSEPEPDLAIVEPHRVIYRTHHPYPENIFWLIEYANSSLSKDLDAKRKTYAIAAIKEYWVVDLKHRQVKIFREPVNDDYCSEVTLTQGKISPLAFPEITVSIQRLLEG
ncbi:Uma2 family endonuclease [Nostocaceae cyanobacterium CENA357]|uniref:Uma2 family endonuclease n=1 Tax=Atlanticothrix silvestris CENA357 TaxID=1725252 RepID=A0A8J7HMB3_9CYAN|nr:Uma2 family endonuclease [Atlanticothrix silvestris]MBH8555799.1 Uma2 family endonuclease [Atlanticothrix silvestris CENA357]